MLQSMWLNVHLVVLAVHLQSVGTPKAISFLQYKLRLIVTTHCEPVNRFKCLKMLTLLLLLLRIFWEALIIVTSLSHILHLLLLLHICLLILLLLQLLLLLTTIHHFDFRTNKMKLLFQLYYKFKLSSPIIK